MNNEMMDEVMDDYNEIMDETMENYDQYRIHGRCNGHI